jgi:hypothetical protein
MKEKSMSVKVDKLNEKIKAQNAAFKKMTATQKRIAIAKDVLKSLKNGKLVANTGSYCEWDMNSEKMNTLEEGSVELQDLMVGGVIESCHVCAIGSIFTSKVMLGDDFRVGIEKEYYSGSRLRVEDISCSDDKMITALKGIFTESQLRLMEFAFEGNDICNNHLSKPEKFKERLRDFYHNYYSSHERLVAIMKNIIKNEGVFKP